MALPPTFRTATHHELFAPEEPACDVCGTKLGVEDEDGDGRGSGLYVWARGGEVVFDEPPLCGACGTAISMSAMARWEIEEEEG
jgi:hypothetical protein